MKKNLNISKRDDEWVDKLANALPHDEWGTYLLIWKKNLETQPEKLFETISFSLFAVGEHIIAHAEHIFAQGEYMFVRSV